jgi:hypothetical protein
MAASAWGKSFGPAFGSAWGDVQPAVVSPSYPARSGGRLQGLAFTMPRPRHKRGRRARERDDALILFKP